MHQGQEEKVHACFPEDVKGRGSVASVEKSARSALVAQQLRALMERHGLKRSPDLVNLAQKAGIALDRVTVNRLLTGVAKTEPRPSTLRLIAQAVGESVDYAFPDKPQLIIEVAGRRFALKAMDGAPMTPAVLQRLAEMGVAEALAIHDMKKSIRKKDR